MPLLIEQSEVTQADRPYAPRGAAREIFRCESEEVLLEGPSGTGKTRSLLEKAHIFAEHYDGCRILLTRQTRSSMTQSVLVTFENKVVPEGHPILRGPSRQMRESYTYPNGSEIAVYGMDKADKIMSTEYDLILVFEATEVKEDDFEKLTTRLRNGVIPYQQIVADCNPSSSSHWLNARANDGRMTRLLSRHEDNPILHDGHRWTDQGTSYIGKLDNLTGHRKLRLRHGKWASAEGVVYPQFDSAIHVIDKAPEFVRRIRTIDFGYMNPFVCQWWGFDHDGRMYLYREIYMTQRIVHDHATQINSLSEGESYETNIADHDAEDRATLSREGIQTLAAKKDVSPGINAVMERLKVQGDGRPRLYIMQDALVERDHALENQKKPCSTVEEFDSYIWKKSADGKPVKDVPDKIYDHGMDGMRYTVMYVDGAPQFKVRVIGTGTTGNRIDNEDIWN